MFSAFSAEKIGEEFAFTWVRFVRFSEEKGSMAAVESRHRGKGRVGNLGV